MYGDHGGLHSVAHQVRVVRGTRKRTEHHTTPGRELCDKWADRTSQPT